MELRSPRTVRVQVAAERLKRKPHSICAKVLPIHGLGRVAAVHGGEVYSHAILVGGHELHLGQTRI